MDLVSCIQATALRVGPVMLVNNRLIWGGLHVRCTVFGTDDLCSRLPINGTYATRPLGSCEALGDA